MVIRSLLFLYIVVLIVDAVISLFPQFRNQAWAMQVNKLAEFSCAPVRKSLPKDLPVDFSHAVVIGIIFIIMKLW
jgi:YggT family protein